MPRTSYIYSRLFNYETHIRHRSILKHTAYSTSEEVKFLLIIFFTYILFYHVYSIDAKKVGTTNHFCSKPNPTFLYKVGWFFLFLLFFGLLFLRITESRVFVCSNIHFVLEHTHTHTLYGLCVCYIDISIQKFI